MSVPDLLDRMSGAEMDGLQRLARLDTEIPDDIRPEVLTRLAEHIDRARAVKVGVS